MEKYMHDRALLAIARAEGAWRKKEWEAGREVCEWCGQPLERRVERPMEEAFSRMVRRMREDPQGWQAAIFEAGNPGAPLAELARFLGKSLRTASAARKRARELLRGCGVRFDDDGSGSNGSGRETKHKHKERMK